MPFDGGIEPPLRRLNGLGEAAGLVASLGKLRQDSRILSLAQFHSRLKRDHRPSEVAARFQHISKVKSILSQGWLHIDCLAQLIDSAVRIAAENLKQAEAFQKRRVLGAQFAGLAVFLQSLALLATVAQ